MENNIDFDDTIDISSTGKVLDGRLIIQKNSHALIILIDDHGRVSEDQRSLYVADFLQKAGFSTLMIDLLTQEELDNEANATALDHLSERIKDVCYWAADNPQTEAMNIGLFTINTGTAAALETPIFYDHQVNALVSLAGRPDLAVDNLKSINIPMLFIAGNLDSSNVSYHEKVLENLNAESKFEILKESGKGFHDESMLKDVAQLAKEWFIRHL